MVSKMPRMAIEFLSKRGNSEAFNDSAEVAAICRTIATARKHRQISQDDLSQGSGIPQAEISRIESGLLSRGPTLLTLVRLARAMGLRLRVQFESQQAAQPDILEVVGHVTPMIEKAQIELPKVRVRELARRTEEA